MNTIKGSHHRTNRKAAILVGVLYIIGTVSGVLSIVFAGSTLNGPDYLIKVSANENQIITGALFVLMMGLALALVPVVMFPILKKHHEGLAAALLWLAVGLLGLFHLIAPMSTIQVVLGLPIGLQEMVMAIWLIARGFNFSPIMNDVESFEVAVSQA